MVGLYTEPIDETLAKLGMYVEPKVRDYVSNKLNIKYKQKTCFKIRFMIRYLWR